jgi:outer membrane beta-barrel protein
VIFSEKIFKLTLSLLLAGCVLSYAQVSKAEAGDFGGYEIRVIRPRYMTKRNRIELGTQAGLIMNQSFIYTLMLSGMLDYHFSEMFALEVGAGKGISFDKEDKRILKDEFEITTSLLPTDYTFNAGLLWTPMYGKTQLPSGYLVYFDNFVSLQAGMTGIEYKYERCKVETTSTKTQVAPPDPTTKSYPSANIGFGQKFFISQSTSIRWDARANIFSYDRADGECTPQESASAIQTNMMLQFGASTFF